MITVRLRRREPDAPPATDLARSSPSGCGPTRATRPLIRSYSLSGPPGAPSYRISVKREAHRAARLPHHHAAQVGDTIEGRPTGRFILAPGDRPTVLVSAASARRRCSPCCIPWPLLVDSPGLVAPRRRDRADYSLRRGGRDLLAVLPNPIGSSATATRHPMTEPARCRRVAAAHRDVLDDSGSRLTQMSTCAARHRSCLSSASRWSRGFTPGRIHMEVFGTPTRSRRGSSKRRPDRRAPRPPGTEPSLVRSQQPHRRLGRPRYCSLLELAEPATCRCAGRAAAGCAAPASHRLGAGRSPTAPIRSRHPPTGNTSSAAPNRRPSWCSTCD